MCKKLQTFTCFQQIIIRSFDVKKKKKKKSFIFYNLKIKLLTLGTRQSDWDQADKNRRCSIDTVMFSQCSHSFNNHMSVIEHDYLLTVQYSVLFE